MLLKLYKTIDSDNVINKVLTDPLEIQIVLKGNTDITNPIIKLKEILNVDFSDFNYAEIPELKRFYFINKVERLNNSIYEFDFECDVLESYKTDILNSNARLYRGIKTGDYFDTNVDSSIVKSIKTYSSDVTLDLTESTFILTTVGA